MCVLQVKHKRFSLMIVHYDVTLFSGICRTKHHYIWYDKWVVDMSTSGQCNQLLALPSTSLFTPYASYAFLTWVLCEGILKIILNAMSSFIVFGEHLPFLVGLQVQTLNGSPNALLSCLSSPTHRYLVFLSVKVFNKYVLSKYIKEDLLVSVIWHWV